MRLKKTAATIMAFVVVLTLVFAVSAAANVQDGVEVSISTDKASYAAADNIVAVLTVKNTRISTLSDVGLEVVAPNGYKITAMEGVQTAAALGSGETAALTVTLTPKADPATGDNAQVLLWVLLILLSLAGIITAAVIYRKHWKKMMSIFLLIGMLFSLLPIGAVQASAATEAQHDSARVYETVTVDGKSVKIEGIVTHCADCSSAETTDPTDSAATDPTAATGSSATDPTTATGSSAADPTTATEAAADSKAQLYQPAEVNAVGSYYTAERVSAARANIEAYTWAADLAAAQINYADMFLEHLDHLLEVVGTYTLPKSSRVGTKTDNNYTRCNYCGETVSWSVDQDMIAQGWKIRCPKCESVFPSNDFGSFFALGYINGVFDYEAALNKHHELFGDSTVEEPDIDVYDLDARNKRWEEICDQWYAYYGYGNPDGYLYNEAFDDIRKSNIDPVTGIEVDGHVWGVDDGYGYFTHNTFSKNNNTYREIDAYIPYYTLRCLRYAIYRTQNFGEAYLYTGDEKYGMAGAILLDRIADVYPTAYVQDWYYVYGDETVSGTVFDNYYLSTGGGHKGKFTGKIEDGSHMQYLLLGCDALRSFLETDNQELIAHLSAKAEEYGLENKKDSAEAIWQNWADNLIYETLDAAKTGDLLGNVGIMEAALALAALVLDEDTTRSLEIMEFLYASAPLSGEPGFDEDNILGGNAGNIFVELLDRDGMGNEGATHYNLGWVSRYIELAEYVQLHTDDPKYNLYDNPKFLQMLTTGYYVTLVENYHVQVGDSGGAGSVTFFDELDGLISTFQYLKDTPAGEKAAEYIYMRSGQNIADLHYGLFTGDPESLQTDILALLSEDTSLSSTMMAGFGFAAVRGGDTTEDSNTLYDYWMNFGLNGAGHSHPDSLAIGMDAYGLNFAPDLGPPQAKNSTELSRYQWSESTISHNTVVVDEEMQQEIGSRSANPLHFDDAGQVKVIDVDSSNAYAQTDIYRRTLVAVAVGDDDSYAVDFFRVLGGSDHLYSFHAQTLAPEDVTTVNFTAKYDEVAYDAAGNAIVGSYAGNKVAYGSDPSNSTAVSKLIYPQGYTWLKDVRRANNVGSGTAVNFKITDSQGLIDDTGLNLRVTMLNDFSLAEVALASGFVPDGSNTNKIENNTLEFMLARRTAANGETLDSLFTTVFEPYNGQRVLSSMAQVTITPAEALGATDVAKAVKVVRADGRVDYIVYATNNNVLYTVTDGSVSFSFRGVVGVYSVDAGGNEVYSYVLDGDLIGSATCAYKAYTGTVVSFTTELSTHNYICVKTADAVDADELVGRWIYINNDGADNGAYEIKGAEKTADGELKLDIGMITLIREYADSSDNSAGYVYNISAGQTFTIPLSNASEAVN